MEGAREGEEGQEGGVEDGMEGGNGEIGTVPKLQLSSSHLPPCWGMGRGWGQGALLQLPPAPALLLAPAPLLSEPQRQARQPTGAAERGR